MPKFKSGAHSYHHLKYHLVWIPKYRKRVLRGKVVGRLRTLLTQCAEVNDWTIEELAIQTDHIHMLVQTNPDISIAKVVQLFKGGSSRILRQEFPELEEFLWGDSFLADN